MTKIINELLYVHINLKLGYNYNTCEYMKVKGAFKDFIVCM